MKKLVILSIVFVFTSITSAGFIFDGSGTIQQGGTINLSLIGDTLGGSGFVWLDFATDNAAGDTLSNIEEPPGIYPPGDPGLPDSFFFEFDFTPGAQLLTFDLTNTGTPLGGIIKVDLLDASTLSIVNTHYVEVVPEPMTLGLLGLGSLLIRKRK